MTDIASALADTSKLDPYAGRDVLRTSIAVRKAGDGLSKSMGIDPIQYPIGARVCVVLEAVVADHKHKPIDGTDALELVQSFEAEVATIVDRELVRDVLDAQRLRIEFAAEAAKGVGRIGIEDEMAAAHAEGLHDAGAVSGCPTCQRVADDATPISGRSRRKKAEG